LITNIPEEIRQVLTVASIIGNEFDMETLAIVLKMEPEKLESLMVLPVSESWIVKDLEPGASTAARFSFSHDKIHQAFYTSLPTQQRSKQHMKIGRILLEKLDQNERNERIFDLVNHLNFCAEELLSASERRVFSQLNLEAGLKAKRSSAFDRSLEYLQHGIRFLTAQCWQEDYDLAFSLYFERGEALYLTGNFKESEEELDRLLQCVQTPLERARIYHMKLFLNTHISNFAGAVQAGLKGLYELGVKIPKAPSKI
jgi:predicted ATPase